MDWVMTGEEFRRLRSDLLAPVCGEVLELGFGTGLNLPHYSAAVTRLHAVDPARLLPERVAKRSAHLPFPVFLQPIAAESLPHHDQVFDYVISTWTLCTIPDPVRALHEVGRVLKPTGVFVFLEHGRSQDRTTAQWQDRLNPLQNLVGCGCNLNRTIDRLITDAGLHITSLDRFEMNRMPRVGGAMYRGSARTIRPQTAPP
jgi:ubiquinone/menaquinone biosynthesis C-methylase UbiE